MVSRRKFFIIIIMMAVLLFMFQFSQVIKENEADYGVNAYAGETAPSGINRWRPAEIYQNEMQGSVPVFQGNRVVLFFGKEDSKIGKVVSQWGIYTKRNLLIYENPQEYAMDLWGEPEMILLDSSVINYENDLMYLMGFAEQGIHMIFCNLPDVSVIQKSEELRTLLGIQSVQAESIKVEGIHIFEGFLLGGSYMYKAERKEDKERQDLQLRMPWYVTLDGTKTYMVGMLDELLEDKEEKNELFPGIIWRNSYGDARIFVVNGDYMADITGIGILSAMVYEMNSYALYPVVNAQNLLLANYPEFSEENTETMMEVYSRSSGSVQQDIVWPTVLTTVKRDQWKITGFFLPRYDYREEAEQSVKKVPFYLQQFREIDAEAGISLEHHAGTALEEKLEKDEEFYESVNNQYEYSAALMNTEELSQLETVLTKKFAENIRTVACQWDPDQQLLSYYNDAITIQSIINEANDHTWSSDIRLKSLQTALGYSNVQIDIQKVIWPESEKFHWEKFYEKVASNLDTYWKRFRGFEKTTLSESDSRVRTFLNLDYTHKRKEDKIYLDIEGKDGDGWFLFRTHGEKIADIKGAEYQEIEKGAFLLHILEDHVEIRLEKAQGVLIYTLPDGT